MNDLISRQAAIDALQKEIDKGIPPFDDVIASIRCGVRLARNIIEDLPAAQPEPQWIPVSERLPEESEYYIITANDGVGHRTTFARFQKKAKSWDLTGARSYWRVIAWMPLPEAYKEGGERI